MAEAAPSTPPRRTPIASPPIAAEKVASRCGQMLPSVNSSTRAPPIRLGAGA
jgi:hypothetical protein